MKTEHLQASRPEHVARAAALLRGGRIVAFPTETVYGLGARADNPEAVAQLQRLKRRPEGKEFALLISSPDDAGRWGDMSPAALALARAFWPGPLTLVVPDRRGGKVGLRCPAHEVTRDLVRRAGAPIAAPSANVSGLPPATTAQQVLETFDGRIAAVLDGGPAGLGVASTVVRVDGARVDVLREGAIPEAALRAVVAGVRPLP